MLIATPMRGPCGFNGSRWGDPALQRRPGHHERSRIRGLRPSGFRPCRKEKLAPLRCTLGFAEAWDRRAWEGASFVLRRDEISVSRPAWVNRKRARKCTNQFQMKESIPSRTDPPFLELPSRPLLARFSAPRHVLLPTGHVRRAPPRINVSVCT
jgi:hypothetical protein